MNPSAPYPGRTLVQSNVIPVQNNTPNNLPSGWFYNGQLLRSDTQFATVVSASVDFGTPSSLLRFTTGNFQWTTDRYIVGCFIDFTLQVTVATLFGSGGAY